MSILITPSELARLLETDAAPRVLDVRWRLDRPDGRAEHLDGHVPGAVFVDLETELSRHGRPEEGRHPLPSTETLQAAARRWGLDDGDAVVVYDDARSLAAARAWWLLRRHGVEVRVLDGGLGAWIGEGRMIEQGDVVPRTGTITLSEASGPIATIDEAASWPEHGVLIDARAPERYRGDVEPMDPVAGHIPGAVNLPMAALIDDGRFRPADELRLALAGVGAEAGADVAAYCGSGITAAHTALAGALAGVEVTVYPGSWSQWSNTPGRPFAMGPLPAADVRRR